jgi:hypothetical protein
LARNCSNVGTVEAASEKEAVEIAIKELRIDPVLRTKLVVAKAKE